MFVKFALNYIRFIYYRFKHYISKSNINKESELNDENFY